MTETETRAATGKTLTLPRNCSRVLSRLLAMEPVESLEVARHAYQRAETPATRHIAMKLRLRLMQEALQPKPEEPAETKTSDEVIEIVPEPVPEEPKPEIIPPAKPKLMKMDLEGDALSQMMGAFSSDDNDDGDFFDDDS